MLSVGWVLAFLLLTAFSLSSSSSLLSAHSGEVVFCSKASFVRQSQKKRVIQIHPGAYQGVYVMGVVNYIKDHYDLRARDDLLYLGSSAGAYNALLLAQRHDGGDGGRDTNMTEAVIALFEQSASLVQLQENLRAYVLASLTEDDFELHKVHIEVSEYEPLFSLRARVARNFCSLEKLLRMCAASSHIPFVTSNSLVFKSGDDGEQQRFLFDGGFSRFWDSDHNKAAAAAAATALNTLNIEHTMWRQAPAPSLLSEYASFLWNVFKFGKNFRQMYEQGYADSHCNRDVLAAFFDQPPPPPTCPLLLHQPPCSTNYSGY